MPRKTVHVVPNKGRGGWDVKKGGASKASKHFETKEPAVDYGRSVSKNAISELLIHNKDGRIGRTASHGGDPVPPVDRDTK